MYNRYIPQPDGSHQRNRIPEARPQQPQKQTAPITPVDNISPPQQHVSAPSQKQGEGILGLFRNLLPKNIDTGDLMIILLLLLMANDCEENRNHALLTLALYFFL